MPLLGLPKKSVIVIVSVDVPVAFKIWTTDGTSINQIEGSDTGTAKDVAVPSFEA